MRKIAVSEASPFPPRLGSGVTRRWLSIGLLLGAHGAACAAPTGQTISGVFEGKRPAPFDPAAKVKGEALYRARSGQHYRSIVARNFGDGLVRVSEDVEGLTLEDIEASNFYRLIEVDAGKSLSDFTVRRVNAKGFERSLSRLRGASRNGLFEDIVADSEAQMGDPIPIGFHLDDACSNITYRRCSVFRCQTPKVEKKYRQGDGFADEGGCANISYIDTLAQECTDGGYDLKSRGLTMVRARAVRNKRNFRLWSDSRLEHIISESPTGSHLSTHGTGPRTIRIERFEIRSMTTAPLFRFEVEGGTSLSIGSYDIHVPPGTRIATEDSEGHMIDWGPQGPPRL